MIKEFQNEARWLSNFHPVRVKMYGIEYPSVEHAYQAAKEVNPTQRLRYLNCTPGNAKRLGRKAELRPDWNEVKLLVMEELVRRKFAHPDLRNKLLQTGNTELIEGNTWHDTFWGVCNGIGENHLGKIIMKIRKEIMA